MTVMAGPQTDNDYLVEGFRTFGIPEGLRGELIDGEIIITPSPVGRNKTLSRLARQVLERSSVDWDFLGRMGLVLPSGTGHPKNHMMPDGAFVRSEVALPDSDSPWNPIEDVPVAMTVEVTWKRPELDREAKRYSYACAGIPLYLLVDRDERKTILFSRPQGDDYRRADWAPFGEKLALPKPFDIELDTSDFA